VPAGWQVQPAAACPGTATDALRRRSNAAAAEPRPSIPGTRADRAVVSADAIMLNHLESLLADAIHLALPTNPRPITGPMQAPSLADAPLLNIAATRLRPKRKGADVGQESLVPVALPHRQTLTGDGETVKWFFPPETGKDIIEIELTPGHLARRGDDYLIKEAPKKAHTKQEASTQPSENTENKPDPVDTLEFRRAPIGPFTVVSRGGTPTGGYQKRSPCRIAIEINAWAEQASDADELMTPALAAALAAFLDTDRLDLVRVELTQPAGTVFSVRLLEPRLELKAVERASLPGESPLIRSTTTLALRAECESTLMILGVAPPADEITVIVGRVKVDYGSDEE